MPTERTGSHTAESLGLIAERLGSLQAQVLVQKTLMEMTPHIGQIDVPREPSLEVGISRLSSWTDALRDAVHGARLSASRLPKLHAQSVSDPLDGRAKQRKKTP